MGLATLKTRGIHHRRLGILFYHQGLLVPGGTPSLKRISYRFIPLRSSDGNSCYKGLIFPSRGCNPLAGSLRSSRWSCFLDIRFHGMAPRAAIGLSSQVFYVHEYVRKRSRELAPVQCDRAVCLRSVSITNKLPYRPHRAKCQPQILHVLSSSANRRST